MNTKILEDGKEKVKGKKLILQANIATYNVRDWLINNEFKIDKELIIEERNRIYEIIIATPGTMNLTDEETFFGPLLLKEKSDIFIKKYQEELESLEKVISNIPKEQKKAREKNLIKINMIRTALDMEEFDET